MSLCLSFLTDRVVVSPLFLLRRKEWNGRVLCTSVPLFQVVKWVNDAYFGCECCVSLSGSEKVEPVNAIYWGLGAFGSFSYQKMVSDSVCYAGFLSTPVQAGLGSLIGMNP